LIQLFFVLLSITLGFIFAQIIHPLAMGLLLLFQTVLIALITGFISPSFWFSYVLFLVFLGGILVLFVYVTRLASNEMFSVSALMLIRGVILIVLGILLTFLCDPLFLSFPFFSDLISALPSLPFMDSYSTFLVKLYHAPSTLLTLLLVLYLFLTLIAVVNITNIHEGPLRTRN
jgi:NADH-ubiquinone oxidoreductase chain 6